MRRIGRDSGPIFLIINADDFGYSEGVTKGIITAAKEGIVTATGIFGNCPKLNQYVNGLRCIESLDVGVHLNLTFGTPLSQDMQNLLLPRNGTFPGKYKMIAGILSRQIPIRIIEQEWQTQIDHCVQAGVSPSFLNSHEHIHQLPTLFELTLRLSERFSIDYVRRVAPEWRPCLHCKGALRNGAMFLNNVFNRKTYRHDRYAQLLGFSVSGNLNLNYIKRKLPTLKRSGVYELMCHPGYENPKEIVDKKILRYHSWRSELEMLLSEEFKTLCDKFGVKLIGFRNLSDSPVTL